MYTFLYTPLELPPGGPWAHPKTLRARGVPVESPGESIGCPWVSLGRAQSFRGQGAPRGSYRGRIYNYVYVNKQVNMYISATALCATA